MFLILLDLEYGLLVFDVCNKDCGLLFVYEKIGYDVNVKGCLFDCLVEWFVKCLKE